MEAVGRLLTCCEFRQLKLVAGIVEWATVFYRAPDEAEVFANGKVGLI